MSDIQRIFSTATSRGLPISRLIGGRALKSGGSGVQSIPSGNCTLVGVSGRSVSFGRRRVMGSRCVAATVKIGVQQNAALCRACRPYK